MVSAVEAGFVSANGVHWVVQARGCAVNAQAQRGECAGTDACDDGVVFGGMCQRP